MQELTSAAMRSALAVAFLLSACRGQTLKIGSDPSEADSGSIPMADSGSIPMSDRCEALRGKELPEGKFLRDLPSGRDLLVGRWFVCPDASLPSSVPAAIEFTADRAYLLVEQDGAYEREGEGTRYSLVWSLRHGGFLIQPAAFTADAGSPVLSEEIPIVFEEDEPLRMAWLIAGTPRFLKQ